LIVLQCMQKHSTEPPTGCIDDQPVEDTTRVYLHPFTRDTMWIYPKRLYVRFYPWVTDTNKINLLLDKYELQKNPNFFGIMAVQQIDAILDIKNNRAEYYFTPYGKDNFCNFGADSLVEYAFGVFDKQGLRLPHGIIEFQFVEGTTNTTIDSFFEANGLRFLYKSPDLTGISPYYKTLITPKAKKNILDLGYKLRFIPFVSFCSVPMVIGTIYPNQVK
ncbi:MAG: hypothetical protein SCK70_05710, partial [bacterium]|nr:hypothetical protein [bacterium]